jgi:hypothetical protein
VWSATETTDPAAVFLFLHMCCQKDCCWIAVISLHVAIGNLGITAGDANKQSVAVPVQFIILTTGTEE